MGVNKLGRSIATAYRVSLVSALVAMANTAFAKAEDVRHLGSIPMVSAARHTVTPFTEQMARRLVISTGKPRERLIEQLAREHAALLNRESGRSIFGSTVLTSMFGILLERAVTQQDLPGLLSQQAKHYAMLSDQLTSSIQEGQVWRPSLREATEAIKLGHFAEADHRFERILEALKQTEAVAPSQRRKLLQLSAGIEAARGYLAVVRLQFAEASERFEGAMKMNPEDCSIGCAGWLFLGARSSEAQGDIPRALDLYRRLETMASKQVDLGTPFLEWTKFRRLSEVQLAMLQGSDDHSTEALARVRAAIDSEAKLPPGVLMDPDHLMLSWGLRMELVKGLIARGDTTDAASEADRLVKVATELVEARENDARTWTALTYSQLVAAEIANLNKLSVKALMLVREAMDSAQNVIRLQSESSFSLDVMLSCIDRYLRFAKSALPTWDSLAYAQERVVVSKKRVELNPENTEFQIELWESHFKSAELQGLSRMYEQALRDSSAALSLAEAWTKKAPLDASLLRKKQQSHWQLAGLSGKSGGDETAQAHYGLAIDMARKIVELEPTNDGSHEVLWDALIGMGGVLSESGRFDLALKKYQQARDLAVLRVDGDGLDAIWLDRVAHGLARMGDAYGELQASEKQFESYAQAVDFARRFLMKSPDSEGWSYQLWYALGQWGKALSKVAKFPQALVLQNEAIQLAESIAPSGKHREDRMVALWFGRRELGETLIRMGEFKAASKNHRVALQIAQEQLGADPGSATWQAYKKTSLAEVADLANSGY